MSLSLVIFIFQTKHGCSNHMKHPLVISLLDYKWNEFGWYIFFGNLFVYLIFLVFLTAFGLVVLSPVERPCKHILYKIFMCVWMKWSIVVVFMPTRIQCMAGYEFVLQNFVELHPLLTKRKHQCLCRQCFALRRSQGRLESEY